MASRWVVTAGHCVKDHASIFSGGYRCPTCHTAMSHSFKLIGGIAYHAMLCHLKALTWCTRVYLGEYKLYQNTEPLPRQKFAVDEVRCSKDPGTLEPWGIPGPYARDPVYT